MKIFIGLVGRIRDGFESSSRGEGRWGQSLVRCLADAGHTIVMAPDTELAEWGSCRKPDNVEMLQAGEKNLLDPLHFDVAIFTSWTTERLEMRYIHADKYLWGIMSWKQGVMVNGYFKPNDYVIRWYRPDLLDRPPDINFNDRHFLLAQPFGKTLGDSKFDNKRIAWVAKESFIPEMRREIAYAARRHLYGIVDACKATGAKLSIFSSHEFDPDKNPKIKEFKIMEKLDEIRGQVTMYPTLPFNEYQRELEKCSVTVPVVFAGSILESVFKGLVPLMYKDIMFSNHPWINGVCSELTNNAAAMGDEKLVLNSDQISEILIKLLSSRDFFDEYLYRLRPMVVDSLDQSVIRQLNAIMYHNVGGGK